MGEDLGIRDGIGVYGSGRWALKFRNQERESRDQGIGIDGVRGKGSVLGVCGFEGCRLSGSGFGVQVWWVRE